jgi:hypothetical protein
MVIHKQASVLTLPGPSPGINSDFSEKVKIKFNAEIGRCKASDDCIPVEDLNLDPVLRSTYNMQDELEMKLVNVTQSTL